MSEFRMPSLGADMESGILTEWLVKPGDRVQRGDIVAVVETDKGAIEIEIFEDGLVVELLVAPDTEVAVGVPLARLEKPGAAIAIAPVAPVAPATKPAPAPAPKGIARASTPVVGATLERRKISPAARKHAREHRIDLARVSATGHGGVVTVADVERMSEGAVAETLQPHKTSASPPESSGMRRAIAATMSRSKREIPHYYLAHTIDLEPALVWLETRNQSRPLVERVLVGVLLIKAAARAVADAPALNGFWRDGRFVGSDVVNVGVVISLRGGGLAAPTLNDVAVASLDTLMTGLRDATKRARSGRLRSSELASATMTVSSLGETGVEMVFPIIHPPQVAIVGFGGIVKRPWVVDDGLHVHRLITATLAADHRASDGHLGARFLAALGKHLARPETL